MKRDWYPLLVIGTALVMVIAFVILALAAHRVAP